MTPQAHVTVSLRKRMAGFTLVELMVAMTLSLILMGGALSILYSTKLTSAQNERVARIQEAGRTAFELIRQDARGSGYVGCARPHSNSSGFNTYNSTGLNNAGMMWDFSKAVYGFKAVGAAWNPALDASIPASPAPSTGSDVLVLRTARPGTPLFRTNAGVTGAADIPVNQDPNATLTTPMPMIISDCKQAEVFIATAWTNGGATGTISHGGGGAPIGNSSASLSGSYQSGALLQPVQTVVYYVASCTAVGANCPAVTPPALWQIVGGGTPQELIQGVEAIQLKFGVDTDQDFLANQYIGANAVTAGNWWSNVVSINLAILIRSVDQVAVEKGTQTYNLLGTNFGPFNDGRNRSVYTTTISLRNDTT